MHEPHDERDGIELEEAARRLGLSVGEIYHLVAAPSETFAPPPLSRRQRARWRLRVEWDRVVERVSAPYWRRRMRRSHRERTAYVSYLDLGRDRWDDAWDGYMLEIHAFLPGSDAWDGPSCDLYLTRPAGRRYRRALRYWRRGEIAPNRLRWYGWDVPGDAWSAELYDEATKRWILALLGRDDIELRGLHQDR